MGNLARFALTIGAVAFISGCGGSQMPIGVPGAPPQSRTIVVHDDRVGSWMLPEASGEDLVYVSSLDKVYVFSYPQLKEVGELSDVGGFGLCSDSDGNVFVPSYYAGPFVAEFAHGGTSPIATLPLNGVTLPVGCAVDPTTGNLAVTGHTGGSCQDYLGIFFGAQGSPTVYCTAPIIGYIGFCGYDDNGNLYVDGYKGNDVSPFAFGELASGSNRLVKLSIRQRFTHPGQVQWDGNDVTIEEEFRPKIYAVQVSGTKATVVGITKINSVAAGQSWIQGNRIALPFGTRGKTKIGLWKYPNGGKALLSVQDVGRDLAGITISIASKALSR